MKHLMLLCLVLLLLLGSFSPAMALVPDSQTETVQIDTSSGAAIREHTTEADDHDTHDAPQAHHGRSPDIWSVIPFVLLLTMIATGPLFYAHFWHKNYPLVSILLGASVVIYYLGYLGDTHHPLHAFAEYFSFISLIAALYIASGGILIKVDKAGTPFANIILLVLGAFLANIIGTTGASMLLIRPFIRLNKDRIKPYHIIFFIFMVSNVGGCLTPIGDPPLFLGFLKGVPFIWTATHLWPKWFFGVGLLAAIFYFIDKRNYSVYSIAKMKYSGSLPKFSNRIEVKGVRNSVFLVITIIAVFIDPNILSWVPALVIDGIHISFIREFIMITAAVLAFKTADKDCLKGNEFGFEPVKEVGFLFIGIFATMMPALQLISEFAKSDSGQAMISVDSLYWFTGALSGVLDNAPTYLNFLAAGMGKFGLDIGSKADVLAYTQAHIPDLIAISVGAVFFGAFTYIGNAPNFMVKAIAEQSGIQMPSFIGYIVRFSIPILLPVLFLTWVAFFLLF